MKNFFLFFSIITIFALGATEIKIDPNTPRVGQEVRFTIVPAPEVPTQFNWFLNNQPLPTTNAPEMRYLFKDRGNYTLRCQFATENLEINFTIAENRSLEIRAAKIFVNQQIEIIGRNFNSPFVRLDLGDGRIEMISFPYRTIFPAAGVYQLKAYDFNGESLQPVTLEIRVEADNRQIEILTPTPRARQKITLRAKNFLSPNLLWDFGDGNRKTSTAETFHFYAQPGNYEISVEEPNLETENVRQTINVAPDERRLEITPRDPLLPGYPLKFRLENSITSTLIWDFGDGKQQTSGNDVEHTYDRPGSFQLRVYEAEKPEYAITQTLFIKQENRAIAINPPSAFAGQEITFKALYFFDHSILWDFGDGPSIKAGAEVTHRYKLPGIYQGKAIDLDGRDIKSFSFQINISADPRQIIVPEKIIEGEEIELKIANSAHSNFIWKIDDDTLSPAGELKKALQGAGRKVVRIIDPTGVYPPLEKEIFVQKDNRQLQVSKSTAVVKEEMTIQALNFLSEQILWDFGDGSKLSAGKIVHHSYQQSGNFQITAHDLNGKSQKVISATVRINEVSPDFTLNELEFSFKSGKYFQIFSPQSTPEDLLLKIKARGRGLLKGKIFLNQKTLLGLFQIEIYEGQIAYWESSTAFKLPLNIPGLHTVNLQLTNLSSSRENHPPALPQLRYFVTSSAQLQILAPQSGDRFSEKETILIRWKSSLAGMKYQIAISEVPFPFLKDDQIKWQEITSRKDEFNYQPEPKGKARYLYIQLRALKAGRVETMSEIITIHLQ